MPENYVYNVASRNYGRTMKKQVRKAVKKALKPIAENSGIEVDSLPEFTVEVPANEEFGDYSTNAAMISAKALKNAPRKIAESLLASLKTETIFESVSIAGPGFINIVIKKEAWIDDFKKIPDDSSDYGNHPPRDEGKILIEFVSANPTGPLHIGHGRGAVVGDAIARLMKKAGYDVTAEYYINDTGLQMENLGLSVIARYRQRLGQDAAFPEDGYKGGYINDIANEIAQSDGDKYLDKSGEEILEYFTDYTAGKILDDIKSDLARFGISFDVWTSEKKFHDEGTVEGVIERLKEEGEIYEKDGAQWLKTKDAGDEKDRVVKRTGGQTTYLAADIAYHDDKYKRGFVRLIDIWGADHHGYVARMKAAVKALGRDPESFTPLLIQIVHLKEGGRKVSMSTRGGEFTSLKEVMDEIGVDATRFFMLTRGYDAQLELDMELAKKESSENPVYYVQYAHARISNIFKTARENGIKGTPQSPPWERLELDAEIKLMKHALRFPELVKSGADNLSPHHITHYLVELAGRFHRYYKDNRVVTDDEGLTLARLAFCARLRTVIKNGMELLGVSAPDRM